MTKILWMLGVVLLLINNDVNNNNDNDSDRNNSNHMEQGVSDATQQYPKRTREQVVNDRYILKQQYQKAALHREMEVELRLEEEIQIQKVVDADTAVVRSSVPNDDGDHVNKKQRQEKAKKQQQNNWNKAKKNHNVIEYIYELY